MTGALGAAVARQLDREVGETLVDPRQLAGAFVGLEQVTGGVVPVVAVAVAWIAASCAGVGGATFFAGVIPPLDPLVPAAIAARFYERQGGMECLARGELGRVARFVVLVLVVVAVIALSASGVLASAREVAGKVERVVRSDDRDRVQSSEQLSQFEFNRLSAGTSEARLQSLVGDPASRQAAKVEGIAIECWYYGVAGTTGAYQFCFQNGRLRTKARYTVWPARPS